MQIQLHCQKIRISFPKINFEKVQYIVIKMERDLHWFVCNRITSPKVIVKHNVSIGDTVCTVSRIPKFEASRSCVLSTDSGTF